MDKKKILILEDEKDIGQLYVKMLQDRGYEAVHAMDGVEGLRQLKLVKPDLILLDLGMPKMNGIEFYQYLCDSKGKPLYSVLVLTGRSDLETVFKDFQVEGFIIKPFQRQALLNEVETIFAKQYKKKELDNAKRIVVIDQNPVSAQKIMDVFSKAAYKCEMSNTGMMGIERVMAEPPDIAIVNLNLADYSGDLVILRLQAMPKTKDVKYVLYVEKTYTLDKVVMDNMSIKSGVKIMCEYVDPAELLEVATKVLKASPEQD